MRIIIFIILVIMFIGCRFKSDNDSNTYKKMETQIIKVLLDSVNKKYLKDEIFVVIITSNVQGLLTPLSERPAEILAWFKYSPLDEYIVVNYLIFPLISEDDFASYINSINSVEKTNVINLFFEEVIQEKRIVNTDNIKQYNIPIPKELYKIKSLMKLYRKRKLNYPNQIIDGIYFHCGIKTNKTELVFDVDYYPDELAENIYSYIIHPVTDDIFIHETPVNWRKEYMERYKTADGIYPMVYDPITLEYNKEIFMRIKTNEDYQKELHEHMEKQLRNDK